MELSLSVFPPPDESFSDYHLLIIYNDLSMLLGIWTQINLNWQLRMIKYTLMQQREQWVAPSTLV